MSETATQDAMLERIGELERELLALRNFFTPDAPTTAPEAGVGSDEPQELLLCRAGELRVALPIATVREVVPVARLLPLPGASQFVMGTLDLRGDPVVVHDLAHHLSGERDAVERTHLILIVRVGGGVMGVKVTDAVDVLHSVVRPVSTMQAGDINDDVVLGVTIHDSAQVMVVDVNAIASRNVSGDVAA